MHPVAGELLGVARRLVTEISDELEASGQEVDFPHWWQSKIVLAKDYIVKAKHYIRAELEKKPQTGLPTFEEFNRS